MKLSMRPEFPGYNLAVAKHAVARFNGQTLELCIAADEEAGTAVIVRTLPVLNGELNLVTVFGKVEIILGDRK